MSARGGHELQVVTDKIIETELVVESRRGTIVGVLHDERGRPVADALVVALEQPFRDAGYTATLIDWDRLGEPVITDEDGQFVLVGLPEGEFVVRAYRRGGGEAIAVFVEVGNELELTITPGGSIAGTVVLEDGSVPRSFRVNAENPSLGFAVVEDFRLTGGAWRLNNLPAGGTLSALASTTA